MESAKEKENKKLNDEILQLLSQPTAKVKIYNDNWVVFTVHLPDIGII